MYRLLLVSFSFVLVCGRVNYCGSKMCGHTNAHTFCMFTDDPNKECKGYMDARLTVSEKARILARLNQRRSAAASGKLRGLPSAGNMLKLRWVEELAREAQRWADQCRPPSSPEEHDDCRDLYSISVGQCVASVVGEAPGLRPESMVDMWYLQSIHYKGNVTIYEPPNESGVGYYGDFGQIIWANAFMVGCGRSRFMTSYKGRLRTVERLVCNVAPRGPVAGRGLWLPTAPAAACPPRARPDPDHPALCAFREEIIDLTDTEILIPIEEHILLNTILDIERNESRNYLSSLDELYLTNLAIATLASQRTTIGFNYIKKRDVSQNADIVSNNNETKDKDLEYNQTVPIIALENEVEKIKIVTSVPQNVKTIGRPKSYKIDELNDIIQEKNVENHVDNPEQGDSTNNEKELKELYGDYEFSEASDDSNIIEELITSGLDPNTLITSSSDTVSTTDVDNVKAVANETYANINPDQKILSNSNASNDTFIKGKSVEDYLSDPETVRQLQEELDRMENALATTSTVKSSKVRRKLRDQDQETISNQVSGGPMATKSVLATEATTEKANTEENKTLDQMPQVFNMVMKYMPYLKEYKNNVLKRAASSTIMFKPHLVYILSVVILTCVITL